MATRPGSGSSAGGYGDEIGSRIAVFGTLVALAITALGAAVALGLPGDDDRGKPVAATQTQTVATQTTPPAVTEPETITEPDTTTEPDITTEPLPEPDPAAIPEPETTPPVGGDCNDGIDNDQDQLTDATQDDGCLRNGTEAPANSPGSPDDAAATSECADGVDNDVDGFVDGKDPRCPGDTESPADLPN